MSFNLDDITGALEGTKVNDQCVDFSGRSLKLDTEDDAKPIVDAINSCKSLRTLDLTGNTLGVAAAEGIARALGSRPELERARWSDMFTGRMKTEIPPALSALGNGMIQAGTTLTVLELSDNAFGPIGVEGLAKLLQSAVCNKLQELRLNNNGLGITGGCLLASALLDTGAGSPPRLKIFIAGRNRLENDGAKALAEVFQKMGSLEEIAMPQNGIYHAGVSALCDAFKHNPNLCTLNLNDNTLGPKGAAAFAKTLPKLKRLKNINFGDCLLKSKGALALATAIRENGVQLETLDVSENEIGLDACSALADAVACGNTCLERVVMAGNRLGGAAGKELLRTKLDAAAELSDGDGDGDDDQEESSEESDADSDSCESDEEVSRATDRGDFDASTRSAALDDSGVEEVVSDVSLFLREPTVDHLNRLGATPADLIDAHFSSIKEPMQATEAYVEATMLLCGLSTCCEHARGAARQMLAHCVRRAGAKHVSQWMLTNSLLVHLALIKSESKTFSIRWDLTGCYAVFSELMTQPFLPDSLKETIRFFAKSKKEKDPSAIVAQYEQLCG